jgi:hypothetical protein
MKNIKKSVSLIIVVCLFLTLIFSTNAADFKNSKETLTLQSAVSLSMIKILKAPENSKDFVGIANKNGWLPKKLPSNNQVLSKKMMTSIFLSICGFKIFDSKLTSAQSSSIDEMIYSVNFLTKLTGNASASANNLPATVSDLNLLINDYKYKNLGWKCMSPACSF